MTLGKIIELMEETYVEEGTNNHEEPVFIGRENIAMDRQEPVDKVDLKKVLEGHDRDLFRKLRTIM